MSVPSISIIGAGNIGSAVAGLAVKAGASTQVLVRDTSKATGPSGADVAEIGSTMSPVRGEPIWATSTPNRSVALEASRTRT